MLNRTPRIADTPRGRFACREGGDPAGYPLVMLHGWPESSYCWQGVSQHLDSRWRLIAPDLRGMGDSTREGTLEDYRKQNLAQDMIALLDEMGMADFHLVGHDWGGIVAQEIALAIPQRVSRLVILNIAIINNLRGNQQVIEKVRQGSGRAYWYQHFLQAPELPEAMIPGNEEPWLRYFLRRADGQPFPADALAEYVRTLKLPGSPGAAANYYRTFHEDTRRWTGLAGHVWPMPALYIYGNRDPVIIPEYLNCIGECFEQIEVVEVEAAHFLQEERPEAVAGHLGRFLEKA